MQQPVAKIQIKLSLIVSKNVFDIYINPSKEEIRFRVNIMEDVTFLFWYTSLFQYTAMYLFSNNEDGNP